MIFKKSLLLLQRLLQNSLPLLQHFPQNSLPLLQFFLKKKPISYNNGLISKREQVK